MLVVTDLDEVFIPMRDGLFVNPQDSRYAHPSQDYRTIIERVSSSSVIENLLESLPERSDDAFGQSALGSAVRAGLAALVCEHSILVLDEF